MLTNKHDCSIIIVGHGGLFTTSMFDLCPDVDFPTLLRTHNHNSSISELQMHIVNSTLQGELLRWADVSHLHGSAAELVSGFPE